MTNEDHGIIKKLVFKLVKKHIAGTTAASMLKTVKQMDERGIISTVTFLNENASTPAKARYNINAYSEIIRQLSRQNLNADISLRLTQLGYSYSKSQAISGLEEIASLAAKGGRKVWLENENSILQTNLFDVYERESAMPLGLEIPFIYLGSYWNGNSSKHLFSCKSIKLTTYDNKPASAKPAAHNGKPSNDTSKKAKGEYDSYIKKFVESGIKTTISSHDEKFLMHIMASDKDYRKNLSFEVPLGYNKKRFGMMLKAKPNLSVYIAYGKDWVPYAISRLTEGRIRDIATAVLDGDRKGA